MPYDPKESIPWTSAVVHTSRREIAQKALHELARRGALTVEQANECAQLLKGIYPSSEDPVDPHLGRRILFEVDLDADRSHVKEFLMRLFDRLVWFRRNHETKRGAGGPKARPSMPHELFRAYVKAWEGVWPDVRKERFERVVRRLLEVLPSPQIRIAVDAETGRPFEAAGVMTAPLAITPQLPQGFEAALRATVPRIQRNEFRTARTALIAVEAKRVGLSEDRASRRYPV